MPIKLIKLSVNGYKNLGKKTVLDFKTAGSCIALIGLNGSGKSNVLEAISLIMFVHFNDMQLEWLYELEYELNADRIILAGNKSSVNGKDLVKRDVLKYLPSQVIACYSGEELRMWKTVYEKPYLDYCAGIRKGEVEGQRLTYLNKYSWEIALITLLCSEGKALEWILELLGIPDVNDVSVRLTFNTGQYKTYRTNPVTAFIDDLNPKREKVINVSLLDIKLSEALSEEIGSQERLVSLFRYLYIAHMPKENKILEKIDVSFGGINTTALSEGEKKMILIYFIQNVLADGNSLVLLDEPDSHVHIERKKQLKEILCSGVHPTILTTHSPTLFNTMDEKSVFILTPDEDGKVKVLPADKTKHIAELTGGEFSLVDATLAASTNKDILLVEGPFDYRYIQKALEYYGAYHPEFDFMIFNCGGCHNVLAVLEQSILPTLKAGQLCLCVFDNDGDGRKAYNNICDLIISKKLENLDCMVYPKHDAFLSKGSDFLVEDYFPKSVYADKILEAIDHATSFKHVESLPKAKKLIESGHPKFPPEAFKHFEVFFKEAVFRQKAFREHGKTAALTKFAITQSIQTIEVTTESTNYLREVSIQGSLTAQLLIKVRDIIAEYHEETDWEKMDTILQKLYPFESLASYRVTKEIFRFLEELSHLVRGGMPREITFRIQSLIINYFNYRWKGEEQTELGKICCHVGFGIAYDGYIKIDDFEVALDGLSILKLCHGMGIETKNLELKQEAISQFDSVLSSLVRPESPELMDAHKFVTFMKDVWLKEVGDLTLPIYPKEIEWLETKNHIRVAARKEAEELKRRRK